MAGAKLIGSVLIVDVLLTLVLGLDLKSSFGIPNENYEADYLRFSGIFTESALYGPVLFLLLFPLTVDKEIVLAHHKTLLILSATGFLTLSVVSGALSVILVVLILHTLPWRGKMRVLLFSLLAVGFLSVMLVDATIIKSATVAIGRLVELLEYLRGAGTAPIDGSALDRVGGLFSGIRYRESTEVLGTIAPTGYRSVAGVVLQTTDGIGLLTLALLICGSLCWAGKVGFLWLVVVLFLPNQFLTTVLTYLSLFTLRRLHEDGKNYSEAYKL